MQFPIFFRCILLLPRSGPRTPHPTPAPQSCVSLLIDMFNSFFTLLPNSNNNNINQQTVCEQTPFQS